MHLYLVASCRPFTNIQISWLLDSVYMIPFHNTTKYMFDNLAYDDLILRSFEICNFRDMGAYFHFKTVDLSSLKFHPFICTRQNILNKVACDLLFPLRTVVSCISCLTSISVGRRKCCVGAYKVLI